MFRTSFLLKVFLFVGFLALCGFFLHAVIPHDHSGELGIRIETLFHGDNRKWFFLLTLGFLSFIICFRVSLRSKKQSFFFDYKKRKKLLEAFLPLQISFRKGILHSKAY